MRDACNLEVFVPLSIEVIETVNIYYYEIREKRDNQETMKVLADFIKVYVFTDMNQNTQISNKRRKKSFYTFEYNNAKNRYFSIHQAVIAI